MFRFPIIVVALTLSVPAYAQTSRPDRPYRGLFGGSVGETEQSLSASGSVGTSFDSNIIAGEPGDGQPDRRVGLFDGQGYASLSGGLSYSLNRTRVGFNASIGSGMQYVPSASSEYLPGYSIGLGGRVQMTRRIGLTGNHSISVQPYNVLVPMAPLAEPVLGDAPLLDPSLGVRREERVIQSSSLAFSRELWRRASVSLHYARTANGTSFSDSDLTTQSATARFSTSITRGIGVYAGYVVTQGVYRVANEPILTHNFDGGLDFSRTRGFEITRRTRLTFGGGATAVSGGDSLGGPPRTSYHATGNAALSWELARAWSTSVSYNRSVGFVPRFADPFLNDSVSAGLNGLLGRRVQVGANTGLVFSHVGLTGDNRYRSYFAGANLSTGITRYLSIDLSTTYYRYGFDETTSLPTGFQRELGRRSVRVSLSTWAPLYNRAKRP